MDPTMMTSEEDTIALNSKWRSLNDDCALDQVKLKIKTPLK